MGLMDKVKAQATQIAEKAQEAGKVGQAKLDALQSKRKADSLLEELGKITYEAHEGRGGPGDEARASDLIEQLRQYEAEYGLLGSDSASSGDVSPSAQPSTIPTTVPAATTTLATTPGPEPVVEATGQSGAETSQEPSAAPQPTPAPGIPTPSPSGLPTSDHGGGQL
jgi:hypothetical protein